MKMVSFSAFNITDLSEAEITEGSILTTLQSTVIKNLICRVMEEKLNLPFTPDKPLEYAQKEAHLKGQMDVLNYLLACSEDAKTSNLTLGV